MVRNGLLEDTSWRYDASPSFTARLVKGWLRLWVEHPEVRYRIGSPYRYSIEVTKNIHLPGRRLLEDDELEFIMPTLIATIENLGIRRHWRLLD